MDSTRSESARTLSLAVSWLMLMYHATIAYLCTYLPGDPLYLTMSMTGYAWYGCAVAVLGIYGSQKRSPTFLTIFSNHLLIDTVLSLVPKIGLVFLFHDLTADMCYGNQLNASFWLPSSNAPLHGPGRVIQTSLPAESLPDTLKARRHCQAGVLLAQTIVFSVLALWTVAQWALGLSIRRYAVKLEMQSGQFSRGCEGIDEEKAFYEEESLADGYRDALKVVQQWSWREKHGSEALVEKAEAPPRA